MTAVPPAITVVGRWHAPVIAALHAQCFADAWSAASIAALLAAPGTCAHVAAADGAPGAFVLCRVAADEGEVLAIGVAPPLRRRGWAAALLATALADAARRGARRMVLEVAVDNRAALGLYARHGFLEAGRRPGYYAGAGGGTDAVILARRLVP
ncbi:MAG: GNAT family N-acetyltransferase [Rhodospirillales bacterium]